ncbi:MAG: hypothetical protein LM564_01120 [Desulfurococcaceae archaeon]|nr:hypothetical protein [Desulfurococcaceae archaeon]
MPSHRVHRLCGSSIGLPDHVLRFIDTLIDKERKCGVHDIGLEVLSVMLSRQLNIGVALDHGLSALVECLELHGVLDELHLRAVALHFLLDCVDREMPYFGTESAGEEPEKLLRYCVEKLEERWRTQMRRYFYFSIDEIESYIEDMVKRIRFLVENYKGVLEECVGEIANEREIKAIVEGGGERASIIREGYGGLLQMLAQLCRMRGVKCILYVNYQPLPVAATVRKALHLLERGGEVTIMLEDRSVEVKAKSLKELRDKVAQLLSQDRTSRP